MHTKFFTINLPHASAVYSIHQLRGFGTLVSMRLITGSLSPSSHRPPPKMKQWSWMKVYDYLSWNYQKAFTVFAENHGVDDRHRTMYVTHPTADHRNQQKPVTSISTTLAVGKAVCVFPFDSVSSSAANTSDDQTAVSKYGIEASKESVISASAASRWISCRICLFVGGEHIWWPMTKQRSQSMASKPAKNLSSQLQRLMQSMNLLSNLSRWLRTHLMTKQGSQNMASKPAKNLSSQPLSAAQWLNYDWLYANNCASSIW